VIGVMARTGSAVAVALGGTVAAPRFLARREIGLVPEGLLRGRQRGLLHGPGRPSALGGRGQHGLAVQYPLGRMHPGV